MISNSFQKIKSICCDDILYFDGLVILDFLLPKTSR